MFNKRFHFGLTLGLIAAVSTGHALAQPTPPSGSVDQRAKRDLDLNGMKDDPAEAYLTGQDDVVLLKRRKFFTVQASMSKQFTDNAYLADVDHQQSEIATYGLIGSASTRLGGRVDVTAYAGAFGARYGISKDLDYDAGVVGLSIGGTLRGVDLSLDHSWQTLREGGFGDEQLGQRRLTGTIAYPIVLAKGRVRVTPAINGERVWADPDAYNNQSATIELPASVAITDKLFLTLKASTTRRFYPDYFPGLLGVKRRDDQVAWQIGVTRLLPHDLALRAEISGVTNHSTSDINRYRSMTGVIGINLQKRF